MTDTNGMDGDDVGLTNTPPRVDALDQLDAVAHYHIGNRAYVYEQEFLADGRVVAYLGVTHPTDTSPWPSQREISFVSYAPVGALVAEPDGDQWAVTLPDRDALNRAAQRRREHEAEQRAGVIPGMLGLFEDRQEMHYAEADDYGFHDIDSLEDLDLSPQMMFDLGRAVGMHNMASLAERSLRRRLEMPVRGDRRWRSSEYDVIRNRRSRDLPPTLEGSS